MTSNDRFLDLFNAEPVETGDEFVAGFLADLADWLKHDVVSAKDAATLLSGFDPKRLAALKDEAKKKNGKAKPSSEMANEEMSADDCENLRRLFQGAKEKQRNLQGWADYAKEKGAKVHSWIERYLDRSSGAESHDQASSMPLEQLELRGGQPKSRNAPHTNILRAVIDIAKKNAVKPDDHQSVWAALTSLADSDKRPPPLLGFVDGEGVKYQNDDGVKFLTKKNLLDRLGRERKRSK